MLIPNRSAAGWLRVRFAGQGSPFSFASLAFASFAFVEMSYYMSDDLKAINTYSLKDTGTRFEIE
jgi:hypothetical protein